MTNKGEVADLGKQLGPDVPKPASKPLSVQVQVYRIWSLPGHKWNWWIFRARLASVFGLRSRNQTRGRYNSPPAWRLRSGTVPNEVPISLVHPLVPLARRP